MNKTDLLALAARVEAAQGADRELDMLVAVAAGWTHADNNRGWWRDASGRTVLRSHVPRYTASLDAAASLVPEGWRWNVSGGAWNIGPTATLLAPGNNASRDIFAKATSPALALTAAALRAMAEEAPDA